MVLLSAHVEGFTVCPNFQQVDNQDVFCCYSSYLEDEKPNLMFCESCRAALMHEVTELSDEVPATSLRCECACVCVCVCESVCVSV